MKENILEKNESLICTTATCPVTLTTQIIGGRWKHLIIYLISAGINRFGAMQRGLPDISKNMLTQSLRELERDGIITREIFAEIPPRVEYALTDWGRATLPIMKAMADWGMQYRYQMTNEASSTEGS